MLVGRDPPRLLRTADEGAVAHELARQWVGTGVRPETWRDVWLDEGFATSSQWLWSASRGGPTLEERFDEVYAIPADDELSATAPGEPGARS